MTAQNPNAISKFVGDLYCRLSGSVATLLDFGAVRGLIFSIDNSGNRVEINSDNLGTLLSGFTPDCLIEVELLENKDRDLLEKLFGGTATDVTGASTTVTDQVLRATGTWGAQEIIYIDGAQQDISLTNVKNNGSAISAANYELVLDPTVGRVGIVNISTAVTLAGAGLTTTYTHTIKTAKELEFTREFTEDIELEVQIKAPNKDNTKYTILTLDKARAEGKYSLSFADPTNGGDLKGAQITFRLQKGGKFNFHDENI